MFLSADLSCLQSAQTVSAKKPQENKYTQRGFILNKEKQELPVTQKQRGQASSFPSPSVNYHKKAHTMIPLVWTKAVFPWPSLNQSINK